MNQGIKTVTYPVMGVGWDNLIASLKAPDGNTTRFIQPPE